MILIDKKKQKKFTNLRPRVDPGVRKVSLPVCFENLSVCVQNCNIDWYQEEVTSSQPCDQELTPGVHTLKVSPPVF